MTDNESRQIFNRAMKETENTGGRQYQPLRQAIHNHGANLSTGTCSWLFRQAGARFGGGVFDILLDEIHHFRQADSHALLRLWELLTLYTNVGIETYARRGQLQNLLDHPSANDQLYDRILEDVLRQAGDELYGPAMSTLCHYRGFWNEERMNTLQEYESPESWMLFLLEANDEVGRSRKQKLFGQLVRRRPGLASKVVEQLPRARWIRKDDLITLMAKGDPASRKTVIRAQKHQPQDTRPSR